MLTNRFIGLARVNSSIIHTVRRLNNNRLSSNRVDDSGFNSMSININNVDDSVKNTVSIRDYMEMTMKRASINLFKVAGASAISISIAPTLMNYIEPTTLVIGTMLGSFCTAIYSLTQISKESPIISYNSHKEKHEFIDSIRRRVHLNLFLIAEGITIAPIVYIGMMSELIGPALIATSGIMAGPIITSYMNPKEDNIALGNFLNTTLFGFIGLGITGFIFPSFGTLWFQPEPYLGILLFSGYNWYDTQMVMESYRNNQIDPMGHSINYTLNFLNIFIRVVEIMVRAKKKNKFISH